MRARRPRLGLLFLVLVLAPTLGGRAAAQNEVYDPEPPRGSAYLRFISALPSEAEVRPDFMPAQRLGTEAGQRVSAYRVVENVAQRTLAVEARHQGRSQRTTFQARPDSFLTVMLHAGPDGAVQVAVLNEEMNFNRARVRLGFYNGAGACPDAGLRIEPSGPAVFEGVAAASARQRTVNAVRAAVRATCGERNSPAFQLEGLEAGASFSVVMLPGAGSDPQAFLVRDATTPWRR